MAQHLYACTYIQKHTRKPASQVRLGQQANLWHGIEEKHDIGGS